jgi:hypothetical protein
VLLAASACAGLGVVDRGRSASRGDAAAEVQRGCPPERPPDGEARLVLLGDSGYGTGTSEWGTPGQEAIAARINDLRLDPDLVFFLGDNIYWTGSANLYATRFDEMYDPLIRRCKVHVALGNHDLKGCRATAPEQTAAACLKRLELALVADRKAQYLRQNMDDATATARAEAETRSELAGAAGEAALAGLRASCLPGDATAYEDVRAGSCNAASALKHAQFGFGTLAGDGPPDERRQRYYSVLYPVPQLDDGGRAAADAPAPIVDVAVLDSNTLRVDHGLLGSGPGAREDRLQLLWLRSALTPLPLPGAPPAREPWKILALHHPPHTPQACACRIFGRCIGGHGDELELQAQLREALQGLQPPDLVFTAHNHMYSRTHPLDAEGRPRNEGRGGVRYFVTGGGGAPLYAIQKPDARFARAFTAYHFVYLRLTATAAFFWAIDAQGGVRDSGCFERGSNVDRPLAKDFKYDDPLPEGCGEEQAAGPRPASGS